MFRLVKMWEEVEKNILVTVRLYYMFLEKFTKIYIYFLYI